MQDLRVAAIQMESKLWDKDYNLNRMSTWCESVIGRADLVLFPELSAIGYVSMLLQPELNYEQIRDRLWAISEVVPGGDVTNSLASIARKLKIFLCAGTAEKDGNSVYNTQVLVGPDGYIGKYRKIHIAPPEYAYFRGGHETPIFDIGTCKVGISICWDNYFPELPRILALKGAEVILMPVAWPYEDPWEAPLAKTVEARRKEMMAYFPSRAYDNRVFAVCLDHAGKEAEKIEFPGVSMIFDPNGQVIEESKSHGEDVLIAHLDAEELRKTHASPYYMLPSRRPEVYGMLTCPVARINE
jgi:predicted amidohydrolase